LEAQVLSMEEEINGYQSKLEQLEFEKARKSRETIEDLQTLVKELNYIEESNENLKEQLQVEKDIHVKLRQYMHILM
jgi:hypothetical protein